MSEVKGRSCRTRHEKNEERDRSKKQNKHSDFRLGYGVDAKCRAFLNSVILIDFVSCYIIDF